MTSRLLKEYETESSLEERSIEFTQSEEDIISTPLIHPIERRAKSLDDAEQLVHFSDRFKPHDSRHTHHHHLHRFHSFNEFIPFHRQTEKERLSLPHDITEIHPKNIKDEIRSKFIELESRPSGLTSEEAKVKLEKYGKNKLVEEKENLLLMYLKFFWNPLSWVMEAAALTSIILLDYLGMILILLILFINATIGFFEEKNSSNSVKALQKELTPKCRCFRDGSIDKEFNSYNLVPGDVISIRLGDIVPADSIIFGEDARAKIDESSLTGESLPVDKFEGDTIYSSSIVKQGEIKALVVATGMNTLYGRSAYLVSKSKKKSRLNEIVRTVTIFCIAFIAVGVIAELIMQFAIRGKECSGLSGCETINNTLVIIVGGIPIAMPTVLSVMTGLGAFELSKSYAIVTRPSAIEEFAAMEVLCSDKTGTLTLNQLSVADPLVLYEGYTKEDIFFIAALASRSDNNDPIDMAIINSIGEEGKNRLREHESLFYHPFDPNDKWAYAKLVSPGGEIFHAGKGAPQVILQKSSNYNIIRETVETSIIDYAKRGYRTIGVSKGDENGDSWQMIGLIPLYDPPRHDTKETIQNTLDLGVEVKMITGDQLAIAKETSKLLGMGDNIVSSSLLKNHEDNSKIVEDKEIDHLILKADGFAQVLPEDKYFIVKTLQKQGLVVGMTGDGVNDAPALKKANVGIAVSGSTDAARSASDIVLIKPGLSVIATTIKGSRKIFQRMKSYVLYSIASCIRIVLTFTLLTLIFDYYFPTIAVAFFALLNDVAMITLSRDRATYNMRPERWNLNLLYIVGTLIGIYLTLSTIILFLLIDRSSFFQAFGLGTLAPSEISGVIYLQVSITNLAFIFSARTSKWMILDRPSWLLISIFIVCQTIASVLGAYGLANFTGGIGGEGFSGGGWRWVLMVWIWSIIWFLPVDIIKKIVYIIDDKIEKSRRYEKLKKENQTNLVNIKVDEKEEQK